MSMASEKKLHTVFDMPILSKTAIHSHSNNSFCQVPV